jgi:FHS family Na+ dependent glucose MFS transporter 1
MAPARAEERRTATVSRSTVVYCLCFTLVGLLSATLGPSMLTFAQRLHSTPAALGLLFSADSFGSVCGSLLAGWLLGRIATHLQAVLALGSITVFVLVIPQLADRAWLLPAWWALGLSKTFLIVTVNTLLIQERRGTLGPFMNIADFFLGAGSLLMPILVAASLQAGAGLHAAYWFTAASAVGLAGWLCRMLPGPRPRPPHETRGAGDGRGRARTVAAVAVLLFFYVGMEISFSGWIPSYVASRGIAHSTADAAYFTSLFWIAVTAGRLLWLPLAARRAPEQLIGAGFAACAVTLGLTLAAGPALVPVVIGTIAFGLAMAPIFPSAFTLLERRVRVTGQISAVCLCTASVGAMFFPWLVGRLLLG